MLDTLLTKAEELLAQIERSAADDDYAKASELSSELNDLLLKLKSAPSAELSQYRDRLAALFEGVSDSISAASEEQEKVRRELIKFNKGAAGVNAYRANGGVTRRKP
ncbi:MAG: hypothetical protein ACI4NA_08795 [Succinivibrio sp.]